MIRYLAKENENRLEQPEMAEPRGAKLIALVSGHRLQLRLEARA